DGVGLGRLLHLGLMNCEFIDDVCALLPTSKIVKQLKTLDLSMGTMGLAGARQLQRHAAALSHLAIDVADNCLDDEAQALLATLPNVHVGAQREHEPDYRYVSVSE